MVNVCRWLISLVTAVSVITAMALPAQQTPARQEAAPIKVSPLAKNIYLVEGGSGANCGFFVGAKDVVLIDAKMSPESAKAMLAEIGKVTPLPVTRVILTHSDGDHVNGLPGLPDGLMIIAQENVKADMIKASADLPELAHRLPSVLFKDSFDLRSDGRKILLRHYGPAHTSGDTVVYFEPEKLAFVGDLVFIGRDPLIHLAKGGSSAGLVLTLKALLDHKPRIESFVSGHAAPASRQDVDKLIQSIQTKRDRIKAMVAEGASLEKVKQAFGAGTDQPPGRRFPSLAEIIYRELTEKK